jgi:putative intracellular protease/amidase
MLKMIAPLMVTLALLVIFLLPGQAEAQARQTVAIILTGHAQLGDTGQPTGFYLSEAAHPWQVFKDAGYEVILASPNGGNAPIDPKSYDRDDSTNAAFLDYFEAENKAVQTLEIKTLEADDLAAVFVAGGHGTMWDLPDHEPLQQLIRKTYLDGGFIAAVCHGPAALVNVKLDEDQYLVDGKRIAAFTNSEEDAVELTNVMPFLLETKLKQRGAEFVAADDFQPNVVASGRLVTGQNPASAQGTAKQVVELINAKD